MTAHPIPRAALEQHIAVLGKTRSGKSSVMRGLVEGLLDAGKPVCIIDPKGDWWGIKLAADGKSPGYPVVIFGGEHADVPINAHAGAHVAELFATGNRPCLIDLGGWMVGERTRFWIDFASTLFRHTRGQRWLVVDEAHNFAPKGKIMDPDSGKALHWANRLASEGLGKGLAMIFASQRPQKVHNDTLTSAETLIAMRVLHPSDRDAVAEWIKGCGDLALGRQVLDSLAQMSRGEGWAWSPEIGFGPERVKFPMFKTYDSFRPQKVGETKGLKGWASVDLDEVKAKLATVVKEAEANDPRRLKARIAELERSVAAKPKAEMDPAQLAAIVERATQKGRDEAAREITELEALLDRAVRTVSDIEGTASAFLTGRMAARQHKSTKPPAARPVTAAPRPASSSSPAPVRKTNGAAGGTLSGGERKILTVLAQYPSGRTKRQIGILAGYAVNGGAFNNYLGSLRGKSAIEGANTGMIAITDLGRELLGPYDPLPTGRELLDYWLSQLDKAPRLVLAHLAATYPDQVGKRELAEAIGYESSGGGFNNALGKLRTLELISGSNKLVAAEELFG